MRDPGGREALCAAEQAVAFAVPFNGGNFVPEPQEAILAGPDMLRGIVAALRTSSGENGFTWHQTTTEDGRPFSPKLGETTEPFADGSELSVLVRTDPPPNPLRMFEIALSLYITPPSGPKDQRHISYDLDLASSKVTRHEENSYGLTMSSIKGIAEELVAADLDEARLEEQFAAALTEADLATEGLDPTLDPDIEALRATDDIYREHSDNARNETENRDLAATHGEVNDQPVGTTELTALGTLLMSL